VAFVFYPVTLQEFLMRRKRKPAESKGMETGRAKPSERLVDISFCVSCGRLLQQAQDSVSLLLCLFAQKRNQESIATAIELKQDDLERVARTWCDSWGLPRHFAADVVAQTLPKIVRGAARFECDRPAWPWLHFIAYRTFLDMASREIRVRAQSLSTSNDDEQERGQFRRDLEPIACRSQEPLQQVLANEQLRRLDEEVDRLPLAERQVFSLRRERIPNKEVASIVGCSEAAATERFKRAVHRLQKALR
jgi:RNA polymerase sigma factor (sigma-70 family)